MIEITESAREYLLELLAKQEGKDVGIRVFITDPGTPMAETCIAYCTRGEEHDGDQTADFDGLTAWFDERSIPFLKDAKVDFAKDSMGGQLTIKAPNSRVPQISDDSPLADKVNYVLFNEINPSLASHGGMITLIEIVDDDVAVLQFGGGCQGCGMVDVTLKDGVEKTLLEQLPQLKAVRDVTDHSVTENAYYK